MNSVLENINNILSEELTQLDNLIKNQILSDTALLNNIIQHIQKMSGKRIRILLALLIAKMYSYKNDPIIKIAAAIDFIHNATLLHDDVIDCNTNRRGLLSANEIWKNKACILAGDFLLSQTFLLISSVNHKKISMLFAQTSSILIEGEINQLIYNNGYEIDLDKYIAVIGAKTASLFSLATTVGGIFAQADQNEIEALKQFGYSLGIAFQITDDLLDYLGNYEALGKPIGVDYKEKKMTLPLILLKNILLENNLKDVWLDEIWNPEYSEEKLKVVISYMKEYSIKNLVEKYVEEYIRTAKNSLECLKKFDYYYQMLINLTDFIVERNV